jgi:hypothetical protein
VTKALKAVDHAARVPVDVVMFNAALSLRIADSC